MIPAVSFARSTGRILAAILLTIPAGPAMAQASGAVPVSQGKAERQDVPLFLKGIGVVQANQTVLVRARVDGAIQSINFTEGQTVHPGDLLATIDPRPYQAAFDQAVALKASHSAQLTNAKRDLERYTDLARNQFASRQSVDTQNANVSQSTAQTQGDDAAIAAAKLNLDYTRLVAPIEGRVGLKLVDVGNLIRAGDATGIVTINQIHPIAALFTLPQDNFPRVQDAMHASASPLKVLAFSADDKTQLSEGELVTIDNAIDTTTGTIRLKTRFANTDDKLWPGQFVNIHLQLSVAKDVVTVPSTAVMHGVNGLYVYVAKPGDTVAVQPVSLGQDDGSRAVVTAGLTGNETVVTGGQSRLTGGSRISVAKAGDKAGDGKAADAKPAQAGG